jgi:hypothetical protein
LCIRNAIKSVTLNAGWYGRGNSPPVSSFDTPVFFV